MSNSILDDLTVTLDGSTGCIVESLLTGKENHHGEAANEAEETVALDEEDIFVCGKCHDQFSSLKLFVEHKQNKCQGSCDADLGATLETPQSAEVALMSEEEVHSSSGFKQTQVFSNELLSLGDSSVVVSNDDFLNLAINETQVFTVNGIYQLSHSDDNKEMVSHLLQQHLMLTSDETSTKDDEKEGPVEALIHESSAGDISAENHKLFHGSLAKPCKSDLPKAKVKQKCPYCSKEFLKNFDLQQHIRSHTGEKPFQCIVCGRAFAQKSNVKKHMNSHKVWPHHSITNTLPKQHIKSTAQHAQTEGEKEEVVVDDSYVCSFCHISLPTYIEFRSHMKTHNSQKVYKCIQNGCEETFVDLDPFVEHIGQHDQDLQYRCHTCSKIFTSLHEFGFHQLEHSMYPQTKCKSGPSYFRCTKCMNKYASSEALECHLKTSSHNFPCQSCPKVFPSERLLRRHLTVHGNVGLIRCSTCSKDFRSVYSLKLHLMTHTGERPFECDVCSAAFNRKDQLKRHALIHESKKLKCPFRFTLGCTREFRRPDKLQLHFVSHAKQSGKKERMRTNRRRSSACRSKARTLKSSKVSAKLKPHDRPASDELLKPESPAVTDEPVANGSVLAADAPVQIIACEDFDLSFAEHCQMKKLEIVHIPLEFSEGHTDTTQVVIEDSADIYLKDAGQMDLSLFVSSPDHQVLQNEPLAPFDDT